MKIEKTAYLLARLPIGMSFIGHGLVRIPKITSFAEGIASSFTETILPYNLVFWFAYILPFVELILGILLVLGVAMRKISGAGVVLMCILIFGSSLLENWAGIATQMFYGLYFTLLFIFANYGHSLFTKPLKAE